MPSGWTAATVIIRSDEADSGAAAPAAGSELALQPEARPTSRNVDTAFARNVEMQPIVRRLSFLRSIANASVFGAVSEPGLADGSLRSGSSTTTPARASESSARRAISDISPTNAVDDFYASIAFSQNVHRSDDGAAAAANRLDQGINDDPFADLLSDSLDSAGLWSMT